MALGWAIDTAVQDQIDNTITYEIRPAQSKLYHGESRKYCEECGEPIPEARHKALPGVRLCIHCQEEADKHAKRFELYNRRGSKDSQLK